MKLKCASKNSRTLTEDSGRHELLRSFRTLTSAGIRYGEAFNKAGLVLPGSFADVVGESHVQRARLVGHDVNYFSSQPCWG